jgi:predicted ATPase
VGLGGLSGLRRSRSLERAPEVATAPIPPDLVFPAPAVPEELALACAKGECILYAGAGLSAGAGYQTWKPFIDGLVSWAASRELISATAATTFRSALDRGERGTVVDGVVSTLEQAGHGAALQAYIKQLFRPPKLPPIPKVHQSLVTVGFQAALTTNFDTLLERSFATSPPSPVFTPRDGEALQSALSQRAFFVAKLYGDVENPPAMISPAQYQAAVATNLPFKQFNEQLFYSRTVFFCGCSLGGILDYLYGTAISATADRTHYALISIEEAGWEVTADLLARRYGIRVIPFTPTAGFPEVGAFIDQLSADVGAARDRLEPEVTAHPSSLKRLVLQNIGAFKDLSLDLDPHLTVLLGDNGVGKSTILRAAAFALAGSDNEPAVAAAFLRGQETSGSIVLETNGGTSYKVDIHKRTDGAKATFLPQPWLHREGHLALGFPPLRMVSSSKSRGPEVGREPPRPSPNDVLPIATNQPDPRTNDLKQWLVNLDYARKSGGDSAKIGRLLKDFFVTLAELLEGVKVDFQDLKVDGLEIKVVTDDGEVPLNALSQGTVSLIGWIGVLLQRLYEVYDRADNPRDQFAIVLMDEIDAHMHPRWQQSLVGKLKTLFPNIQFVATTHSPFIVAGREPSEIVRLRRDLTTREIRVEPAYADTKGADVASILRSYLFDLQSVVDKETEELILERRDLVAKVDLTPEDRARLERLNKQLDGVFMASTRDPGYDAFIRAEAKRQSEAAPAVSVPLTRDKRTKAQQVIAKVKQTSQPPDGAANVELDQEAHQRAQAALDALKKPKGGFNL